MNVEFKDVYTVEHTCKHTFEHHLHGGEEYNKAIISLLESKECPTCHNDIPVKLTGGLDDVHRAARIRDKFANRFNRVDVESLSDYAEANYRTLNAILHNCPKPSLYIDCLDSVADIDALLEERDTFRDVVTASCSGE